MKFGISTWIWSSPLNDRIVSELIPKIAEIGFDWIELPIENTDDFDVDKTKDLIEKHGLDVSCTACMGGDQRDLISPSTSSRQKAMDYVKQCTRITQALGGTNLSGPMYTAVQRMWRSSPDQREQELNTLVLELQELSDYAFDHGVMLCIEPVNRFETCFINTADQAVELVDRVNKPACGLIFDTFHLNIEEKLIGGAIRKAGKRLKHLHAGENDRGSLGQGHLPWPEVSKALKDINYEGAIVMETFTDKVDAIAEAASVWRPLFDSSDEMAKEGLAFLRRTFL